MTEITFISADDNAGLVLKRNDLEKVIRTCRSHLPEETGGILLGHYSDDRRFAIVRRVIFYENQSLTNRYMSFILDGLTLTKTLKEIWFRSKGKEYYLGEWHSHPQGSPIPSHRDIEQMKNIAKNPSEECEVPILLIIGRNCEGIEDVKAFIFSRLEKHSEMKLKGD